MLSLCLSLQKQNKNPLLELETSIGMRFWFLCFLALLWVAKPTQASHVVANFHVQDRATNSKVLVVYTRGLDFSSSSNDAGGVGGLLARTFASGSTFYQGKCQFSLFKLVDDGGRILAYSSKL